MSTAPRPRLGAYVLAADPAWIRTSILRYYDHLDVLVVAYSPSGRGWTGAPIRSRECVEAVREIDTRGIVRTVVGEWSDLTNPMAADTAQRTAALTAVGADVDWVLQLDTDEVLPDIDALLEMLAYADEVGVDAVEWPMRVLYRRLRGGGCLEIVNESGGARYEYPGAIAVRPGVTLVDARRSTGRFLRPVVEGDESSLQIRRPTEAGEIRGPALAPDTAIIHNSWARSAPAVRRKVRSWGHGGGSLKSRLYYWLIWLPAPVTWRWLRSFHPFAADLWPRLAKASVADLVAIDPRDVS